MADIRCLCLDVDGVLTDGRLYVGEDGRPLRAFHIHDGLAIRWFRRLGGRVVIITGKTSRAVEVRAEELDVEHVAQGSRDKLADLNRFLRELGMTLEETAAIGDDLPDVPVLRACALPIAVANAVAEVKAAAKYVTQRPGGEGAVREAIERILRAAGKWDKVTEHFGAG